MEKQLLQVLEFHKAFNIPVLSEGEQPTQERIDLRKKLIIEEFNELKEAHESGDIEHIAKEACDLVYVCLGTALEFGWGNSRRLFRLSNGIGHSTQKKEIIALENAVRFFCMTMNPSTLDYIAETIDDCISISAKDFEQCFDEVHRSNMSKLDANGNPIYRADGKVLKSELYSPADLSFLKNDVKELA